MVAAAMGRDAINSEPDEPTAADRESRLSFAIREQKSASPPPPKRDVQPLVARESRPTPSRLTLSDDRGEARLLQAAEGRSGRHLLAERSELRPEDTADIDVDVVPLQYRGRQPFL